MRKQKNKNYLVVIFSCGLFLLSLGSALLAEDILQRAYTHLSKQEYMPAISLFEEYLQANPGASRIHLEVAYVYLKISDDPHAETHFLRYLELTPEPPTPPKEYLDVQAELAFLYTRGTAKTKAIKYLHYILKYDSSREELRLNLAYLLLETNSKEAYSHFHILARSADARIREKARQQLRFEPKPFGYMAYLAAYYSNRFEIDVLNLKGRVYYKGSLFHPIEPYLFLNLNVDNESNVRVYPMLYSEQAMIAGAGVQWYPYKRNIRLFIQYGLRKQFLQHPDIPKKKDSLSFGAESFFFVPLSDNKKTGLEMNNVFLYYSHFNQDFLFEGKEVLSQKIVAPVHITFYMGVLYRWDSKKYFYNNNLESVFGVRCSLSRNYTYFLYGEYVHGSYMKDTVYGHTYNEFTAGLVIGLYH